MDEMKELASDNEGTSCSTDDMYKHAGSIKLEQDLKEQLGTDTQPPTLLPEAPNGTSTDMDNANAIVISNEDLLEVGVEMNSLETLNEEQIGLLMQAAERRAQREHANSVHDVIERSHDQHYVPNAAVSDALTMVITDDGSLKLTDTGNQTFFFSSTQLSELNIDVNNLSDESIQQIIQMALPVINVGKAEVTKRDEILFDHGVDMLGPSTSGLGKQEDVGSSQLIGEQVEVKRDGKIMLATIRYVRNGGGCKVQFDDGHFEWISDEQIIVRSNRRADHEGYHNDPNSRFHNLKRLANEPLHSPAKRLSTNEPNFCCPICENKVHQLEPAFIVIRIPACDSCTREKIVVLEENLEEDPC